MDFLGFLCGAPTPVCSLCQRQRAAGQEVLSWVPVPGCPCWDADSGFGASWACSTSGLTLWFWFDGQKLPSPLCPQSSLQSLSKHSNLMGPESNPDPKHSLPPGKGFFFFFCKTHIVHPREVGKSLHLPCRCHHCCCGSTRLGLPTLLGALAELHHLQFFFCQVLLCFLLHQTCNLSTVF